MPKYSEKFLNDRNKIYQENNKLLDMLFAVYKGNFIQGQAKEICFYYDYKREIKKGNEIQSVSYTDNTFNNLFRKLEELNLIDRKRFKDTNNLCVSFKKGLISMILNIPQDKISANRNAMNNSTNEVFNLSLFKGYVFLNYYQGAKKIGINNYNYNQIINLFKKYNTNIFLTDKDILDLYKWINKRSNEEYNALSMKTNKINQKVNNIKNVREIKKGNNDVMIYNEKKRTNKDRGELFIDYDLISLKRRKIFVDMLAYNQSDNTIYFTIDICVLNNKYSYQKLYKDIGEAVSSMYSLLKYYGKKYILIINVVGFNKNKLNYLENEFDKKRKYKMNGAGNFYESNKEKIHNEYKRGNNNIVFNFVYKDYEKYIGNGFAIE